MIQALEDPQFFTETEKQELKSIQLAGAEPWNNREVFATLMLAAILELTTADGVTTPAEFQEVEEFLVELESKYELTTRERLEGSGASMGLLPFLSTQWPKGYFHIARNILGAALERIDEEDAHAVRNSIAKVCRHAVKATAGFMYLAGVDKREKTVLDDIISSLKLDQCAEGLKLIGRS